MAVGNPVARNGEPDIFRLGGDLRGTVSSSPESSVLSFGVPMS